MTKGVLVVVLTLMAAWNVFRAATTQMCPNNECPEHHSALEGARAHLFVALFAVVAAGLAAGFLP